MRRRWLAIGAIGIAVGVAIGLLATSPDARVEIRERRADPVSPRGETASVERSHARAHPTRVAEGAPPRRDVETAADADPTRARRALTGTVRSLLEDEPIADARITLSIPDRPDLGGSAVSDARGRYRILGWPSLEGRDHLYTFEPFLRAAAAGFVPLEMPVRLSIEDAESAEPSLDLWLTRGARLAGRVVSFKETTPIAGAILEVRSGSHQGERLLARATSSSDGRFTIDRIPSATFHEPAYAIADSSRPAVALLRTSATGFATNVTPVDAVSEGETLELDVELVRACTIRGRVVDRQGRPHAGARVGLRGPVAVRVGHGSEAESPTATTDEAGFYVLEPVPVLASRTFTIQGWVDVGPGRPPGRDAPMTGVDVGPGESATAPDLVVPRLPAVVVTVFDEAGRPVGGAGVSLHGEHLRSTTDAAGVATALATSTEPRSVRVRAEGFVAQSTEPVTPAELDPPHVTVELERGHWIRGRVLHADGTPAPHASVEWIDGSVDVATAKAALTLPKDRLKLLATRKFDDAPTGSAGFFHFQGLLAGAYHVAVTRHPVHEDVIELLAFVPNVAVDGELLVITIPDVSGEGAAPTGSVLALLRERGRPALNAGTIELRGAAGEFHGGRLVGPGRLRFEGVPFGSWTLTGALRGRAPIDVPPFALDADHPHRELVVELELGTTLTGRVRDFEPLARRRDPTGQRPRIHALGPDAVPVEGELDESGAFTIHGLHPGAPYRLELVDDDGSGNARHWLARETPGIAGESPRELDVVEYVQGARLRIRLADLPRGAGPSRGGRLEIVGNAMSEPIVLEPRRFPVSLVVVPGAVEVTLTTDSATWSSKVSEVSLRGATIELSKQ